LSRFDASGLNPTGFLSGERLIEPISWISIKEDFMFFEVWLNLPKVSPKPLTTTASSPPDPEPDPSASMGSLSEF